MLPKREIGTVLAALRYWQRKFPDGFCGGDIEDIATDCGEQRPLDDKEVDALCEHINCSSAWLIHLEPKAIHSAIHRKDQWMWPSFQVIVFATSEDHALDELSENVPISMPEQWTIEAIQLQPAEGEEPWTLAT
jgi:hypothetical protein